MIAWRIVSWQSRAASKTDIVSAMKKSKDLHRKIREEMTQVKRIGLISIILIMLPGCVVVGGYSSERGWFLWPGTIVIFLVVAVFVLLLRRRK